MFALALFGSVSRKTDDLHSDRDLLIVCNSKLRYELHNKYCEQGYSVSTMTGKQLACMNENGSLFIQHLKSEAQIFFDRDGELHKFLSNCELVPPTSLELQRCKATLQFIASCPDTLSLSAWKADFLYCISRDYLIKEIAKTNKLAFGLEDIAKVSMYQFGFKLEELDLLRQLRIAKTSYRSNEPISSDIRNTTSRWLDILNEKFSINLRGVPSFEVDSFINFTKDQKFNSNYERLRSMEGLYLIARAEGLIHPDHDRLIEHIVNPNLYGSSKACKIKQIETYLCDIRRLLHRRYIKEAILPHRFATLQLCS